MSREERYTQLYQNFKKLESKEKDDVNNLEQFVIVSDRRERHLLQINLVPAGIGYFRGQKIYSNDSQLKITKANAVGDFLNRLLQRDNSLSMIINNSPSMQIVGVKHPLYSGQILILDLAVYKQSFYYNSYNLIASKRPFTNIQNKHQLLPQLRLVQHKSKVQNIFDALDVNQEAIVLQAESTIMQKQIAEDEQFYLFNRYSLIAASRDVKLQLVKQPQTGYGLKVKGKGWLFYQTQKSPLKIKIRTNWGNFLIFFFAISLATSLIELMLATM